MKVIAVTLNICLFFASCYLLQKEGVPKDFEGIFMFSLITILPVVNLWCFYANKQCSSDNVVTLYFKRKALEEKIKINNLQKLNDNKENI